MDDQIKTGLRRLLAPPQSLHDAVRMARLASWVAIVRAGYGAAAFAIWRPTQDEIIEQLKNVRGPVTGGEAEIDTVMFEKVASVFHWISGTITAIVIIVCLGAAYWQWRRPSHLIPAIGLALSAMAVLLSILVMMDEGLRSAYVEPQNVIMLALMPVLAVMLFAAYRGGKYCYDHRTQQP